MPPDSARLASDVPFPHPSDSPDEATSIATQTPDSPDYPKTACFFRTGGVSGAESHAATPPPPYESSAGNLHGWRSRTTP